MSGSGAPTLVPEALSGDVTVTIVASSWHDTVMDGLIAGARRALGEAGVSVELVRVPGSFELPLGCARAFDRGADAVVALTTCARARPRASWSLWSASVSPLVTVCSRATTKLRRWIGAG